MFARTNRGDLQKWRSPFFIFKYEPIRGNRFKVPVLYR